MLQNACAASKKRIAASVALTYQLLLADFVPNNAPPAA